jgi:hypothetical protein
MAGSAANGEESLTFSDLLAVPGFSRHLCRRSDHSVERAHHEEPEHQQQRLGCRVSAPGRQESHADPSRVLMQVWAKHIQLSWAGKGRRPVIFIAYRRM